MRLGFRFGDEDDGDHGRCHTTSDYGAGVRKAISVIKNRFHSGGRQQPAEDLPPCRGADFHRHRIRSHYPPGIRGQQFVDAIGCQRRRADDSLFGHQ